METCSIFADSSSSHGRQKNGAGNCLPAPSKESVIVDRYDHYALMAARLLIITAAARIIASTSIVITGLVNRGTVPS